MPVFNIYDLILLFTAIGGFVACGTIYWLRGKENIASNFLALFFLCISYYAFATLLFWSERFQEFSLEYSAIIGFLYVFSSLMRGPALYLYVKSISTSAKTLSNFDYAHLALPVVGALVAAIVGSGVINFITPFRDMTFANAVGVISLAAIPWIYVIYTAWHLHKVKSLLGGACSSVVESGSHWLYILVFGYVAVWSFDLFVAHIACGLFEKTMPGGLTSYIGILKNFLGFVLFFCLYFYSVSSAFARLSKALKVEKAKSESRSSCYERHVEKIVQAMENDKLYLKNNINVERFSEHVGLPAKDVSFAINMHLNCNFMEFVNRYRVEDAKQMLVKQDKNSITDIMFDAGFNSKSSFYRVFRRFTGESPSQYRENHKMEKRNSASIMHGFV